MKAYRIFIFPDLGNLRVCKTQNIAILNILDLLMCRVYLFGFSRHVVVR